MPGINLWSETVLYDKGELVTGPDNNIYRALIGSNIGNDPTTNASLWLPLSNSSSVPEPQLVANALPLSFLDSRYNGAIRFLTSADFTLMDGTNNNQWVNGWTGDSNTTVSTTTNSVLGTAKANGNIVLKSSLLPVTPNYTYYFNTAAVQTTVARSYSFTMTFFNASGSQVGTLTGTSAPDSTSSGVESTSTAVSLAAPATAATVQIIAQFSSALANEQHGLTEAILITPEIKTNAGDRIYNNISLTALNGLSIPAVKYHSPTTASNGDVIEIVHETAAQINWYDGNSTWNTPANPQAEPWGILLTYFTDAAAWKSVTGYNVLDPTGTASFSMSKLTVTNQLNFTTTTMELPKSIFQGPNSGNFLNTNYTWTGFGDGTQYLIYAPCTITNGASWAGQMAWFVNQSSGNVILHNFLANDYILQPGEVAFVLNDAYNTGSTYIQLSGRTSTPVNTVAASGTAQTIPSSITYGQNEITLTGNCTLTMPTVIDGAEINIFLTQDATGSRTVTWSSVTWSGGTAPTLTTTANKTDWIKVRGHGSNWFGHVVGLNY